MTLDACASPVRGLVFGGKTRKQQNHMITIPTTGNATKLMDKFGDATQERGMVCSNSVRGLVGGGHTPKTTSFIETASGPQCE